MPDYDEEGQELVDVDQRALVNILSRYPGEFDVLRELIQNADDAEAPSVEIHFQTQEKFQPNGEVKDVSTLNVRTWIIKNKGYLKEKDWKRLGKIAAGNKDTSKVGAFGVGFYSVLSKTDRPIVRSKGKSLQFCRDKDGKLRMKSSESSDSSWDSFTSIELELRDPEPLPVLSNLARFLVSSVALLTNINIISVHLDNHRLLQIQKESCEPVSVTIPSHLTRTSPLQTLTVESIKRTVQRITINATEWAFASCSPSLSPPDDTADTLGGRSVPSMEHRSTSNSRSSEPMPQGNVITHDLYTAVTKVNPGLHPEIQKGVAKSMKSLPSSFNCKAVYFNPEQHDSFTRISNSRLRKEKGLPCLLSGAQGIIPENDRGRIFIGQSTNQTTGIGLHVSAHFLPTMERSSIDLANGHVAAWNNEVLWVSGFLARVIYEEEMRVAKSKNELATQLGLATMARFAFGSTSPHSGVSQILQEAFFSCCNKNQERSPFPVVSDDGITCASDMQFRHGDKNFSFLNKYWILHREVSPCQNSQIICRYKIPKFKFADILREFETGVTPDAMKAFFEWWEDARRNAPSSIEAKNAREGFCQKFRSKAVLRSSRGNEIALKGIEHFTFFPLPPDLSPPDNIYLEVIASVPSRDAVECFGWDQLSLLEWLEYACSRARQQSDPDLGRRISRTLVQFALVEGLTPQQWIRVAGLLKDIKCIPTNAGLTLPRDSYFADADICRCLPVADVEAFDDIPMTYVADGIRFGQRMVDAEHIRMVLTRLGVRQMMEWADMIEMLEKTASEESNDRLLQFLVIFYRDRLHDPRISDLRKKKVFYSRNCGRVSATDLHLPNEEVRKLGLPILAVPPNGFTSTLLNNVDPSIPFAMEPFILSLGIQKTPTLENVIKQAASKQPEVQRSALQYLLLNLDTRYNTYKPENFAKVTFIPTKCGSLACPNEVFTSSAWEKLGFKQASDTPHCDVSRLGVKDGPSVDTIIECFENPGRKLPDVKTATIWFEQLFEYGKIPALILRDKFSTIAFVPVEKPGPGSLSSTIEYFAPKECFITSSDMKEHHRNIFPFVDFGQNGNSFLESCLAKKSPDASDIVRKMVQDPQKYLENLGGSTDLYLEDLRTIASRFDSISEEDRKAMQGVRMFLAFRQPMGGSKLLLAHQVAIGDWETRDFGCSVFLAPKDDAVEKMYSKLELKFLGAYVEYDIVPGHLVLKCTPPFDREQIIRRIRCFMRQRDTSEKVDSSFHEEDTKDVFEVKTCKTLTMKKKFAPPVGVLADPRHGRFTETPTVPVSAGLVKTELEESRTLYTLWVVACQNNSVDLRNDIAVALCRVCLKSFGPNDVLLLASLLAMEDKSLVSYYESEMKSELPSVPEVKVEPKHGHRLEFHVPSRWAKRLKGVHLTFPTFISQPSISPEADMQRVLNLWGGSDTDGEPNFNEPCQRNSTNVKHHSHCKQAHTIMLKEKHDLKDEATNIRFFLDKRAHCRTPPEDALRKFAQIVLDLATVFGKQDVHKVCYIFWRDADEDLMAFNRDQKYIFLNLAHYYERFYNRNVDEKKVIVEWYLIMAHEIAHNATLDHDEYHGSLSSRLVMKHLPALQAHYGSFDDSM